MNDELIYVKLVKLKKHHKTTTLYLRDKILDEYAGNKVLVKVYKFNSKSQRR